ncbi:hypothetical protein GCM10022249_17420 [Enteractinococcus coprophilus]
MDRETIEKHKSCMLAEVRAYLLRELREQVGFTAAQLAERIGMRRHLKAVTGRSLLSMF